MKSLGSMAALVALASMGAVIRVEDDARGEPLLIDTDPDAELRPRSREALSEAPRLPPPITYFDRLRLERAEQKRLRRAARSQDGTSEPSHSPGSPSK